MTTKRPATGSRGKPKKLKLKKESIKDLSVKKGAAVKGGLVIASPSEAAFTGCGATSQCPPYQCNRGVILP